MRLACVLAVLLLGWARAVPGAGLEGEGPVFLVSRAGMEDPNFHDSVVLLTRHGPGGALGFVVNKPTEIRLAKVFADEARLKGLDDRLFFGGPVAPDVAVFVFRSPQPRQDAQKLLDGVYIGSSLALLHELLARDPPTADLRVFAGLAGWAPGQLEAEFDRGDWRMLPVDAKALLDTRPGALWGEMDRRASATMAAVDAGAALR